MDNIAYRYRVAMNVLFENDGHYHIRLPMFYTKDCNANTEVDFIFDTGAYLTVIARKTAIIFGWHKLHPIHKGISLSGFAGSCEGDLTEIPGMVIGGRHLKGVKVGIPYIDTEINILGLNVIDHFNYLFDSGEGKIYFSDNENYKVPSGLRCKSMGIISI